MDPRSGSPRPHRRPSNWSLTDELPVPPREEKKPEKKIDKKDDKKDLPLAA